MLRGQPSITAVVCTYNRYEVLAKAIMSLGEQDLPADQYRILVIDNSPDADRAHAFSARFRELRNFYFIHEAAPGLSHARNLAVRECGTEFIAFLDDDAIASKRWLAAILAGFAEFGGRAMIVGGPVLPIWGAPRPSWLHDKMLFSLSVIDWGGVLRRADQGEWFCGANIAFRTRAILESGGFAIDLGRKGAGGALLSNEESQAVAQIRARGGLMIYAPQAKVEHLIDESRLTHAWFRKRMAWQATSDFLMDPGEFGHKSRELWLGLRNYLAARPPHERTMRGLLIDTDDPDLFYWQLGAIYNLTSGLLDGWEGVRFD
jgi:glycosyltransferase involved in cell wall biosynthesis